MGNESNTLTETSTDECDGNKLEKKGEKENLEKKEDMQINWRKGRLFEI